MEMEVKCLHATPILLAVWAGRTSHDSGTVGNAESFESALDFLEKLTKMGHTSVLEHIVFTFHIKNLSRAALQELARHRMSSMTVKSTRYTLKKGFKKYKEQDISEMIDTLFTDPSDMAVLTKQDQEAVEQLKQARKEYLEKMLQMDYIPPNDILKYYIPESLVTELVWTINLRSYLNFLHLRLSPKALKEMQELAAMTTASLPENHKALVSRLYAP